MDCGRVMEKVKGQGKGKRVLTVNKAECGLVQNNQTEAQLQLQLNCSSMWGKKLFLTQHVVILMRYQDLKTMHVSVSDFLFLFIFLDNFSSLCTIQPDTVGANLRCQVKRRHRMQHTIIRTYIQ